ncbi:hypothetical protein GCM10011609_63720 [Lentzea pudingi]|uniref:Uncharacterized protein n=1 Tax=Lentzea pudingi TaxID=1789439 RepID=A0ABQ2IJR1_9PSEU|nr:hypothetical protein GCM10011609_63720 [Lentzea pudingi]
MNPGTVPPVLTLMAAGSNKTTVTRHNAANAVNLAALVTPLGSTFTSAIPANDGNRVAGIAEVNPNRRNPHANQPPVPPQEPTVSGSRYCCC